MTKHLVAALLGTLLFAAPAVFAADACDDMNRTEAKIGALDTADTPSGFVP